MDQPVRGIGLNLRLRYLDEVLATQPRVAFWEVIAENLFDDPKALHQCEILRQDYPLSLHCVGMNLAGTDPLDDRYLKLIGDLQIRLAPFQVSDHLCWQRHAGVSHYDLLPFPFNEPNIQRVEERISRAQERLQSTIAIENLSYYVEFRSSTQTEAAVLNSLANRTGCGVLLDLNNIEVNEHNLGHPTGSFLDEIDFDYVVECHVAAGEQIDDVVIDTHGGEPSPFQRLQLSERTALQQLPICYERDRNVPELAESLGVVAELQSLLDSTARNAPAGNATTATNRRDS